LSFSKSFVSSQQSRGVQQIVLVRKHISVCLLPPMPSLPWRSYIKIWSSPYLDSPIQILASLT
jgi:hypothetical protein